MQKNKKNNNKNNNNNILNLNIFYLLGMFFIITAFTFYLLYKYSIFEDYNSKLDILETNIQNIEEKNNELLEQAEYKSSDEHIEELAREKLGMLKNNEVVFYDTNK